MTKIRDFIQILEAVAPPHLQESYDNAGLIVGHPDTVCTGVLFTLDSTESVVEEARRKNCNLIVAHHPIVFRGLKRINGYTYVERTIINAIRQDIAIYAIHTNLDNVLYRGVNGKMAEKIGLTNLRILQPRPGTTDIGAGAIGELPEPVQPLSFLQMLKERFHCGVVRHTRILAQPIRRVALCGGAGSFLTGEARRAGADILVTADFKYHEFFDAEDEIMIADIGHYESEQFTNELLFGIISEKFPTFALHLSDTTTNPVHYF
jgi:dinuclear metal center YbgI/SA1388 family protein